MVYDKKINMYMYVECEYIFLDAVSIKTKNSSRVYKAAVTLNTHICVILQIYT